MCSFLPRVLSFSANWRWSVFAAHPNRHCQDLVNQIRTRTENLQLHSDAEERRWRVNKQSTNTYLLLNGFLRCGLTNTQLKEFVKNWPHLLLSRKKGFVCWTLQMWTCLWRVAVIGFGNVPLSSPLSSLYDGQNASTLRESFTGQPEDSLISIVFVYRIA